MQETENTKPLIVAATHDKTLISGFSGEGSFGGEGIFHGTLPGRKLEEIRALSQEYYGSGGLVPQRLFYVKGLYKIDCIATWMS